MNNTVSKLKGFFLKITLVTLLLMSYGCSYQGALAPIEEDPYEQMNRSIYQFNENLSGNLTINNMLDHRHTEIIGGPQLGRIIILRLQSKF